MEGRGFKLFLQKHTKHKLSAILTGTVSTILLQSSSIVNLMVLSFVGAGMLTMRNALAFTMGANVGSTFINWIFAILGFKIDLNTFSLPIIGISGISLLLFKNKKKVYNVSRFLMGIGLLFLGLEFMKTSMESSLANFDFKPYLAYNRLVFVLIGLIITSLIQTSSATIVLVLSAMYAKIIPVETGVAVMLGAELGTTLKLLIGSIGGIAAKKRVAYGNIYFNIFTTLFGFILLIPIIQFIQNVIGLNDPLLVLVCFQTFINVAGVILFYFFIDTYANFLEKHFNGNDITATYFIPNTSPEITHTATQMLEKEVELFIYRVIHLNGEAFKLDIESLHGNEFKKPLENIRLKEKSKPYNEKYDLIKQAEGEILNFYAKLVTRQHKKGELDHLNRLVASIRNAMYSAKSMKDILHDRKDFGSSVNQSKFDTYKEIHSQMSEFYSEIGEIFSPENKEKSYEKLEKLLNSAKNAYETRMENTYRNSGKDHLTETDISTLLNLNRELYSSSKALVLSIKDYILDEEQAETFENLPTATLR